jgi:hypothetical protein
MRDESRSNARGFSGLRALSMLLLAVAGCESGSGGAVELSWKLLPNSSADRDKFVDCDPDSDTPGRGSVTWIQLIWSSLDASGLQIGGGHDEWHCSDNHGVTGFSLDEGTASLVVMPLCGDQQPADPRSYIAPAPVLRTISRGNTVSLNAVELAITVEPCGAGLPPCICQPTLAPADADAP